MWEEARQPVALCARAAEIGASTRPMGAVGAADAVIAALVQRRLAAAAPTAAPTSACTRAVQWATAATEVPCLAAHAAAAISQWVATARAALATVVLEDAMRAAAVAAKPPVASGDAVAVEGEREKVGAAGGIAATPLRAGRASRVAASQAEVAPTAPMATSAPATAVLGPARAMAAAAGLAVYSRTPMADVAVASILHAAGVATALLRAVGRWHLAAAGAMMLLASQCAVVVATRATTGVAVLATSPRASAASA